jgi:hypothetical protein
MGESNPYDSPNADTPTPDADVPSQPGGGCGIVLLGVLIGAILGGAVLCFVVDLALDREQQAMKREIQTRIANGEKAEDAKTYVIMSHKRMPIAAAIGFFMELGVAAVVGGGIGGVLAAAWHGRTVKPQAESRNAGLPR